MWAGGSVNQRLRGRQQATSQQVPRLPAAGLSVPDAKPQRANEAVPLSAHAHAQVNSTEAQQICKQRTRYTSLRSVQGLRLPSSFTR